MRKVILLFILVLVTVGYVNLPLIMDNGEKFAKTEQVVEDRGVGEPISVGEINSFLNVWPDFTNSWVSKLGIPQLSLTTSNNMKRRLPYITIAWLNRRGWDADRFFYVEQRLRSIVRSAQTEEHVYQTIDILEKKMKESGDNYGQMNVKHMIDYHKKSLNVEKVSSEEIKMVRSNLVEISKILENNQ
ncbi:MAG: hypothetical protein PHE89_05025 [Alphaproteobacteria bacterium]|nr:hypothetical protein [Alphaproteobacteria bacterium]